MLKTIVPGVMMYGLLWAPPAPVSAQSNQHAPAIAAAIERALSDEGMGGVSRAGILLDTVRSRIDSQVAAQLAQELGVTLGRSEAHCRRFLSTETRGGLIPPVGYEVHGASAIVTVGRSDFHADSAHVWITTARGRGTYIGAPRSYAVRYVSGEWRAEPYVTVSPHGTCAPQLFTAPLVMAAQEILVELEAPEPLCYDPTGFFLHERDSVATTLGAELRGRWVPLIDGDTPEFARDPCERDSEQWGSVVRFLEVDWQTADVIHVSLEARVPATQTIARRRYTLSRIASEWIVSSSRTEQ